MGREAQRRAANMAHRALRNLYPEPGGAVMPKVETFDCSACGQHWNKRAIGMLHGTCKSLGCGGELSCSCGTSVRKHFDGWDGNLLDCEEAARR